MLVWCMFAVCGLLQLPLLLDLLTQVFGASRFVHTAASKLLIALLAGCGGLSLWLYVTVFLPRWQAGTESTLAPLSVLVGWLWTGAAFHLITAIRTSPGCGNTSATATSNAQPAASSRGCKKCERPKLPFAHHCSVCGCCIDMMDHHCPFLNNCAGRSNFVSFLFFLGFSVAGAAMSSYLSLPAFLNCTITSTHPVAQSLAAALRYDILGVMIPTAAAAEYCQTLEDTALTFVATFLGLLCAALLLGVHILMLWLDVTTLDCLRILGAHGSSLLLHPWLSCAAMRADLAAVPRMDKWRQVWAAHRCSKMWL